MSQSVKIQCIVNLAHNFGRDYVTFALSDKQHFFIYFVSMPVLDLMRLTASLLTSVFHVLSIYLKSLFLYIGLHLLSA